MPVLTKQLPVIIVSKAVITKESAVTSTDALLEMFLPNSNEIAQQNIATEYRDSPGVQKRVIDLCPGFPQMLVWSLQAAATGEADPPYCSYSFFSACHRKTGVEDCGCICPWQELQSCFQRLWAGDTISPSSSLSTGDVPPALWRTMRFGVS